MKCSKCGCDSDHNEIEKLKEENKKLRDLLLLISCDPEFEEFIGKDDVKNCLDKYKVL
jgi:hypothetical protein